MAKLGPRVSVPVGKNSKGIQLYSYMLKSIAENFNFSFEAKTPTRKNKKNRVVPLRGSKGAKHIKVPKGPQHKYKNGSPKYVQIPIPASMNISQISAFLAGAKKNKPSSFVSDDGRTHSVGKT